MTTDAGRALVTGGTSGIGHAAAALLARQGWQVDLVGRDERSAAAAAARIRNGRPEARLRPMAADHARLGQVRQLADALIADRDAAAPLTALVLAAAVANPPEPRTPEGLDATLTINYLAPMLLRRRLASTLIATGGRIILFGSSRHFVVRQLTLTQPPANRESGVNIYETTKLLTLLSLRDHQLRAAEPLTVAIDPGFVRTGLGRSATGAFRILLSLTRPIQDHRDDPQPSSPGRSPTLAWPTVTTSTRAVQHDEAPSPRMTTSPAPQPAGVTLSLSPGPPRKHARGTRMPIRDRSPGLGSAW